MTAVERQAEERESEPYTDYTALFDDAVTGMAVVGRDGRFDAVNPALCQMLGFRADELVGLRPADITHPDERARSLAVVDQLLTGRSVTDQLQKRYIRADGRAISVVRTTTVLRDQHGEPTSLFTQVVDVTALTDMQETVSRSEQLFKAMVAHASDLILMLDQAGRIRYASPASSRIFDYTPAELQGRDAFDFIHPDDLERARRMFAQHSSVPGAADPVSYRILHHDGSWRSVELVATNLYHVPSVARLVVNVRDITEQVQFRQHLEAGERRFRTLVGNSWDIISLHDAKGRFLFCSPAGAQLGYDPERLVGTHPGPQIHPDDRRAVREAFRTVRAGSDQSVTFEYRMLHLDGTWRWLESIAEARLDDPAVAAVVVTSRDVTVRRRRMRQQKAVAQLGEDALRGGPVENLLQSIPAIVAEALALQHCHLEGFDERRPLRLVSSSGPDGKLGAGGGCRVCADAFEQRSAVVRSIDGGLVAAVPVTPATGSAGVLAVSTSDPDGLGDNEVAFLETVASILAAALSRRNVEVQLRHQAVHDTLTELPNRALLADRLATALSRLRRKSGSVAVLFVDLDNFKLINDSLGHSVGDAIVAAVARRLQEVVRSSDTVARFGGDEFVVVCEQSNPHDVRRLAERIRQRVAAPIAVDGRTITVTASVGFATSTDPAASPDSLLADADMAMYEAKRAGKNNVAVFTSDLRQRTTDQLETVSGIRRGIEANEFRLYYQPIIDVSTGRTTGHEALLRWQHPTSGLILPGQFIDYAETSELIIPLGKWVLDTGCAQSATWRKAGLTSRVSMNVSARQLTGVDIAAHVADALERSGARPSDVYVEVTESAFIDDLERARKALESLRCLGVHLGLDDFGTGWSSLSQLVRLPFDFVKIDRSFVRDLDRDPRTAALLESIMALCATLGLDVVVEGVETASQLDYLTGLGARLVQGFLFGRPQPAEVAEAGMVPVERESTMMVRGAVRG